MKTVRIVNGAVREVIPDYALPVEEWYSSDFAAQCIQAPDEVEQRWIYKDGAFYAPSPADAPEETGSKEPSARDDTDAMLVDHEYRITLLELGVNE